MRRKMLVLALAPALLATTCIRPIKVGVAPAPVAETPTFHLTHEGEPLTYVNSFRVSECLPGTERDLWRITRDYAAPVGMAPLRITYGRVPQGYVEEKPALPLAPGGCYRAEVAQHLEADSASYSIPGRGRQTFRLLPTGRIIVGEPGGLIFNSAPFRQLNRAAVGCTRGYRRAATPDEKAAVDAREYPVLDARLSCGWLAANWPDVMRDPVTTERGILAGAGAVGLAVTIIVFDELISRAVPE